MSSGSAWRGSRATPTMFSRAATSAPKAAALADLQSDPDRLHRPVKRVGERFVEIGWSEALELAAQGLRGVQERHGADAVANYLGNPGAHSAGIFAAALVRKLLGSRNNYSATSTDQLPQYMSSFEMFGHYLVLPSPTSSAPSICSY